MRTRFQYISVRRIGVGRECPPLDREDEECIHCEVDWLPWGECENGRRTRYEGIKMSPVGAGDPCPVLQEQTEGKKIKIR